MDRYQFQPNQVYNFYESDLSTIHSPVSIISTKGTKQVQ